MDVIQRRFFGYSSISQQSEEDEDDSKPRTIKKPSTLFGGSSYSFLIGISCFILLFILLWEEYRFRHIKSDLKEYEKIKKALEISEEGARILIQKHTDETNDSENRISVKNNELLSFQNEIKSLKQELSALSCRAGLVTEKKPSEESLKQSFYRLAVDEIGDLTLAGSTESAPGVNHILGQYRNDQYHIAQLQLSDKDIVVDIGSHIGFFALSVAKKFPNIKVFAFEPLPANFYYLQKNVERLKLTNVVVVNKGVSSHGYPMRFWLNSANTGGSNSFEKHSEEFCVPTITMSQLFSEYIRDQNISLLNFDCEGCEYDVVRDIPLNKVKWLQIELHGHLQQFFSNSSKANILAVEEIAWRSKKWY